ncbi:hypothetical protein C7457_1152 [Thermovibrio guaymasensis]|uniref:Uncharacterized protein n=2 Tax=Thermovibrio guaymasensis TaxID=240167 RepID=A0A420W6K0_9BACT|nr:hypothetical protein C7457_1152 [Thermovibrio guaymasensis]
MMDKLLNFLILLFSLIIVVSLGVIFLFYNPSVVTNHFEKVPLSITREIGREKRKVKHSQLEAQVEEEKVPQEVKKRVNEIKEVISNYLVYLQYGSERKPSLVLKVELGKLYLLTYYLMAWPFVKVELNGYATFTPDKAYLCRGLIVLEIPARGLLPPEVSRGVVEDYGALLTFSGSEVKAVPFVKGECRENGFVFNLAGEFSGVCFGGDFIDSNQLYREVPQNCRIVYQKEVGNGDL